MIHNSRHIVIPSMLGLRVQTPRGTVATANWWVVSGKTCVAAYQPKGAASYDASKVNLANPGTYNATEGVAPSWAAGTGWTFNGSSQYLTTVVGGNSYSALVRFSDGTEQSSAIFGETKTTTNDTRLNIYPYYSGGHIYFRCGGNYDQNGYYTFGVLAVTPAAAYANGTSLGSLSGAWTGTTSYTIALGGHCINASIDEKWTGKIQAFAIYSDTLSSAEVATVSAAMAAL